MFEWDCRIFSFSAPFSKSSSCNVNLDKNTSQYDCKEVQTTGNVVLAYCLPCVWHVIQINLPLLSRLVWFSSSDGVLLKCSQLDCGYFGTRQHLQTSTAATNIKRYFQKVTKPENACFFTLFFFFFLETRQSCNFTCCIHWARLTSSFDG